MSVKSIEGYQIYLNRELGRGSYGRVYIGKKLDTNEEVAIKLISKEQIDCDEYIMATVKNQIEILRKVHSENIIAFYDYKESSTNYYIVGQLCDSDLTKNIKPGVYRPQEQAIQMLRQICNGFSDLIRDGIIHRDLKPANILIKGKTLKLADFGLSKQLQHLSMMMKTGAGTIMYNSWEMLKRQKYTSKCDIWALGIIFYQILHGTRPWIAKQVYQLVQLIESKKLTIHRQGLSEYTIDFLQRCLKLKEADRISWNQIFAHPIFKGYFTDRKISGVFQNKMKMIMNKLRFKVSYMNLNIRQLINSLPFNLNNGKIYFKEFNIFLKKVYPEITSEEADYCFRITDVDNSGYISITELQNMLVSHGIKLEGQFSVVPSFQRTTNGEQSFVPISPETSQKIKSCFNKLLKILPIYNYTLQQAFDKYSGNKRSLTFDQFTKFIKITCSSSIQLSQQQIRCGFKFIDKDNSNSVQFQELNNYYHKVNGISPAALKLLHNTNSLQPIQQITKQIDGYLVYMNKELGRGCYSNIYLGKKQETNQEVAVKVIPKKNTNSNEDLMAVIKNELQIIQKMHCQNIVTFYDCRKSANNYYIIMQLCEGSLSSVIQQRFHHPQTQAIQMIRQICNGYLALIHAHIIHRDLKPANILIKGNTLKLNGFGQSKQNSGISMMMKSATGTPLYNSWQRLKRQKYSSKCDVWALGLIFYELLHGVRPWKAKDEQELIFLLESQPLIIHDQQRLSKYTIDFLQRCLQIKEADRPSWDEIVAHPIFEGYFIQRLIFSMSEDKTQLMIDKSPFQKKAENVKQSAHKNQLNLSKEIPNGLVATMSEPQLCVPPLPVRYSVQQIDNIVLPSNLYNLTKNNSSPFTY